MKLKLVAGVVVGNHAIKASILVPGCYAYHTVHMSAMMSRRYSVMYVLTRYPESLKRYALPGGLSGILEVE